MEATTCATGIVRKNSNLHDLKTKLYRVLDLQADAPQASAAPMEAADSALDLSSGFSDNAPSPAPTAEASVGATDDGDDDLAMFKELARG